VTDTTVEILLVEDNPDDETLALVALQDNKIANNVHIARDGEEAIQYLASCARSDDGSAGTGAPRLILLDLKLPKVSGIDVLKFIKASPELKLVPVVVLTSSREDRDIVESYQLGANSYIVKPVTFEQFTESVRQIGMYWLLLNQPPLRAASR
jgi:CheY-like chemotaxis protein